MTQKINRNVYTPPSERSRTATGRTAAGDRRKARKLGFKSVKQLYDQFEVVMDINRIAALNLLDAFIQVGEPDENPARRAYRYYKKVAGSPRQFVRAFRESYAFRDAYRQSLTAFYGG